MKTAASNRQLVENLTDALQSRIFTGEIPLGSWLRQEHLASEFGVSRTPVREALQRLEAAGLVELFRDRGALVQGPTAQEIRESYLVRAELEGLAAELATRAISPPVLQELRRAEDLFGEAVHAFRPPRSGDEAGLFTFHPAWGKANDLFHEVVHEASGNRRLVDTIGNLHRSLPRNLTSAALSYDRTLLLENVEQHRQIREAIEARRPREARSLMQKHIARAGELVAGWFETHQPPPLSVRSRGRIVPVGDKRAG